ncbi:MAG: DUF2066 domain-containing protein [Xanthomonadales bacterium]|nr:DUF2066 domain-containing protein [Xanthomonadales bacterium]
MRTGLLTLALMLLPLGATAADGEDLFTGEAAVENQGPAARSAAFPLALRNVLQKVTGLRGFSDYPSVEPALENAASQVLSFYYRKDEKRRPDGTQGEQLMLVAEFSEAAVLDLVRTAQLPFWQTRRKPVEAWVVVDDSLQRQIMPVEYEDVWRTLEQEAASRGLELNWPRADEDGMYPVDVQLLWGGYTEDLGGRDGHGVMIAAARREGPAWSVRVNLAYGGDHWVWRSKGVALQSLLGESVQQAVDHIAAANAIAATDLGIWSQDLRVTGLRKREDYLRCLNYLEGLDIVNAAAPVSARPGSVLFRLELSALPRYLEEAIESGRTLEFVEAENAYVLRP